MHTAHWRRLARTALGRRFVLIAAAISFTAASGGCLSGSDHSEGSATQKYTCTYEFRASYSCSDGDGEPGQWQQSSNVGLPGCGDGEKYHSQQECQYGLTSTSEYIDGCVFKTEFRNVQYVPCEGGENGGGGAAGSGGGPGGNGGSDAGPSGGFGATGGSDAGPSGGSGGVTGTDAGPSDGSAGAPGNQCVSANWACDPLSATSCGTDGSACDLNTKGDLECFPPPNTVPIGGACNNDTAFCAPGGTCATSSGYCAKFCCTDADCGGATCMPAQSLVSAIAVSVGICVWDA